MSEMRRTKVSQKLWREKFDEACVALGFTVTTVGDEERPVCFTLSQNVGSVDSMTPNKWRRHLQTIDPNHADKPREFFFLFSENVMNIAS